MPIINLNPVSDIENDWYYDQNSSATSNLNEQVYSPTLASGNNYIYSYYDGQVVVLQMESPPAATLITQIDIKIDGYTVDDGSMGYVLVQVYVGGAWQPAQHVPASDHSAYVTVSFTGSWSTGLNDIRVLMQNADPMGNGYGQTICRMYAATTYSQSPATAVILSGPSSINVSSSGTFTVSLNGSHAGTVVTPSSSGSTINPSTISLNSSTPSGTFTVTPSSGGEKSLAITNDAGLTNSNSPFAFTAVQAASITNFSFEIPSVPNSFTYRPTGNAGQGWVFNGNSGVTGGGGFGFNNPTPLGTQAAILQDAGANATTWISQTISTIPGSLYTMAVWVGARSNLGPAVEFLWNDVRVGSTFTPNNDYTWREVIVGPVTASGTTAEIKFRLANTSGNDVTTYLDNVRITYADPVPATAIQFINNPPNLALGTSSTMTVSANGTLSGNVSVTPSDGGAGGTFSPTSVTLTSAATYASFTYTTTTSGVISFSTTNSGSLTNASLSLTAYVFRGGVSVGEGVWYVASDVVQADSTVVSEWVPRVGTGTASEGNNGYRPLYKANALGAGKPGIQFDGSDDRLNFTAPNLSGQSFTICMTLKPTNSSANLMLGIGSNGSNNQHMHIGFGNNSFNVNFWFDDYAVAWSNTAAQTVVIRYDATNRLLEVFDGLTLKGSKTTNSTFQGNNSGQLGRSINGSQYNGAIGEILIIPRRLSDVEKNDVTNELISTYTTTVSLLSRSGMFFGGF